MEQAAQARPRQKYQPIKYNRLLKSVTSDIIMFNSLGKFCYLLRWLISKVDSRFTILVDSRFTTCVYVCHAVLTLQHCAFCYVYLRTSSDERLQRQKRYPERSNGQHYKLSFGRELGYQEDTDWTGWIKPCYPKGMHWNWKRWCLPGFKRALLNLALPRLLSGAQFCMV